MTPFTLGRRPGRSGWVALVGLAVAVALLLSGALLPGPPQARENTTAEPPRGVTKVSTLDPRVEANLALGHRLATRRGWGPLRWAALRKLWMRESGWRHWAQSPYSSAYGIPQFLDSTWASTGIEKTSDPRLQIIAGMRYITARYGGPIRAWRFWQAHHWYRAQA
jgi:hypothetical protein